MTQVSKRRLQLNWKMLNFIHAKEKKRKIYTHTYIPKHIYAKRGCHRHDRCKWMRMSMPTYTVIIFLNEAHMLDDPPPCFFLLFIPSLPTYTAVARKWHKHASWQKLYDNNLCPESNNSVEMQKGSTAPAAPQSTMQNDKTSIARPHFPNCRLIIIEQSYCINY